MLHPEENNAPALVEMELCNIADDSLSNHRAGLCSPPRVSPSTAYAHLSSVSFNLYDEISGASRQFQFFFFLQRPFRSKAKDCISTAFGRRIFNLQ